jgi:hypothetical protein
MQITKTSLGDFQCELRSQIEIGEYMTYPRLLLAKFLKRKTRCNNNFRRYAGNYPEIL